MLLSMRVPNVEAGEVPLGKVSGYLLNEGHPDSADKAAFFLSHGFSPHRPRELASALIDHLRQNDVVNTRTTHYGSSYALDGPLVVPDGTSVFLRSVWFIDIGTSAPRLVTAYPIRSIATPLPNQE